MRAKIKVGSNVMQDRCFGQWPSCILPSWRAEVDPDMEFTVRQRPDGSWICVADGFGAGINGIRGRYGNGAITVLDRDGIEEIGT